MLLLIAKRLVHHSIPRWFYNRWRNFSQVLAVKMVVESWNAPELEACLAFNTAVSSKPKVRASVFTMYKKLAAMQKDILSMTELMGAETSAIHKALATIATIPEADRPYIKLLYPAEGLDALHSRHFTKFTTAARAIASIYDRSMENYQQRENPKLDEFARTVQLHIQRKAEVSLVNSAESMKVMLNTRAGAKLLELTQDKEEEHEPLENVPLAPRT